MRGINQGKKLGYGNEARYKIKKKSQVSYTFGSAFQWPV